MAEQYRHLIRNLQEQLDCAIGEDPAVHGGILLIDTPSFHWEGASGVTYPGAVTRIMADDQFAAASITKMMTATGLMLLVEDGHLGLETKIGSYLPESLLCGLHSFRGCDYGQEITIRQLLNHTSGLADFFGDGIPGERGFSPFVETLLREPDTFYDPLEILAWTKKNLKPLFPPGQGWHYSDTGYLLIGLLIEARTEVPLHEFWREKLFTPLYMNHTYLLYRESDRPSIPGRSPSQAFMGTLNYAIPRTVSVGWAGAGLMTTAADLSRFLRAFTDNRIFHNPSTKAEMLTWIPTGEEGIDYGLGVWHFFLERLGMPEYGELWGHTGFVKSFMLFWPEQNAILCGTLNQSDAQGALSRRYPVSTIIPACLKHLHAAFA